MDAWGVKTVMGRKMEDRIRNERGCWGSVVEGCVRDHTLSQSEPQLFCSREIQSGILLADIQPSLEAVCVKVCAWWVKERERVEVRE